jgi:hypothetical protein
MNRVVAHLLTRLYPRHWRERYGEEFEELLQDGGVGVRTFANVLWSALCERIFPTRGGNMDQHIDINVNSFGAIIRRPSAFLPIAMSLTALAVLGAAYIVGLATGHGGLVREPDEGTVAHLWQILMAGQMPIIGFFAIKWLPRAPKQTLHVLALHVGAALASMAPVFFLNL